MGNDAPIKIQVSYEDADAFAAAVDTLDHQLKGRYPRALDVVLAAITDADPRPIFLVSASGSRKAPADTGVTAEQQELMDFQDADGWRQIHPDVVGHLSAADARNVWREERGLPPEGPAEAAAAEAVLAAHRAEFEGR